MYRSSSPNPYGRAASPNPYGRAASPNPYGQRAPSPYQAVPPQGSPYQQTQSVPHHQLPGNEGVPTPGTITYTTTVTPDGRTTYHPFRSVLSSDPNSSIVLITVFPERFLPGRSPLPLTLETAADPPISAICTSYQTAAGIVSGIQWVPAEATHVFPVGAQPASEVRSPCQE